VTRGIADREKDRFVLAARALERLGAPWVPVNRIVLVLKKVGTVLCGEAIGHDPDYVARAATRATKTNSATKNTEVTSFFSQEIRRSEDVAFPKTF
jgi:hypothetical protein